MLSLKILVVQETDWMQSLPLQSHQIMESLAQRGHEVTVIDYEAHWTVPVRGQHMGRRVYPIVERTHSGSPVRLVRPGMAKVPGVARLTSTPGQFSSIFGEMSRNCDVVVLYSVPTNGVLTLISARILAKPVLFHSFDVLHRMTGHSFLAAPTWALERFVYKRVDKIIVISAALREYMRGVGVPRENIVLLPPAVDTIRFNPSIPHDKFRSQLNLNGEDKVVLFSGWLYEFSGLDVIMKSFGELTETIPRLRLLVCGDGPMLSVLQQMNADLGLKDRVEILGRIPFREMPMVIASADLCINPYLADVRSNYAFPSKLVEYMACGKAVLATDLPGTRSLLPSSSGVELVSPSGFVKAMTEILLDDNRREKDGRSARRFCETNFSLSSVTDQFEHVLDQLVGEAAS